MKKYKFALALLALMPFAASSAYEYQKHQGESYTNSSVKINSYKKSGKSRKTSGYKNVITNNFYYNQPAQAYVPEQVSVRRPNNYNVSKKTKENYSSKERKFFLAHPFFQPLQGKIGSVTDVSYAHNKFNFDVLNGTVYGLEPAHDPIYGQTNPVLSGVSETSQFAVKEDLSFGLTDSLALMLMAQYDSTKTEFKDWSDGSYANSKSNSDLNLFGIGLQNRFMDDADWMVTGELYFQHQKDSANMLMGGLKAGHKIHRTTIYGFGRLAYINLIKGDTYGAYVDDPSGDWLVLSYNTNIKDVFHVEGGVGAFAVLNKYFTLNGEMMFGRYDWHNQMNVKAAVGYQPNDIFALNLYASAVLFDSANGKTRTYMSYDVNPTDYPKDSSGNPIYTDSQILYTNGEYKIKDYNEWKIGVQAILYF